MLVTFRRTETISIGETMTIPLSSPQGSGGSTPSPKTPTPETKDPTGWASWLLIGIAVAAVVILAVAVSYTHL